MNKVSVLELCALELCDCVLDSLISGDDIKMSFTGANPVKVLFKAAEIKELRILGYEVLNEDEEAVFDMPDIEGNYGTYTLEDSAVTANKIIRHKYIDFDREFLYDPQQALIFRNKISGKAKLCYYIEYSGYNGEDLTDTVSFKSIDTKKIGLVNIKVVTGL